MNKRGKEGGERGGRDLISISKTEKNSTELPLPPPHPFSLPSLLFDLQQINIEPNHTTLAGHCAEHDIVVAGQYGMLGSIDANTGVPHLGWDTDCFMSDTQQARGRGRERKSGCEILLGPKH